MEIPEVPLARIIDYLKAKGDGASKFDVEANKELGWFGGAARTLEALAQLIEKQILSEELESAPAGIVVSLDLADQTGRITGPAFVSFTTETVPSPGEAMVIDGVPYALHGRQWQLNSGALEARLLAVKIAQGPAIVAAPANALDVLSGRKQGG